MSKDSSVEELAALMDGAFRAVADRLFLNGPIITKVNYVCFSVGYTGNPYGLTFSVEMMDGYIAPVVFLAKSTTVPSGYYDDNGKRQSYNLYEAFQLLGIDETATWDRLRAMYEKRAEYADHVSVMAAMAERHWGQLVAERDRLFNVPPVRFKLVK